MARTEEESLDYYLEWNPRFWEAPFEFGRRRAALELAGKRVLEIGPRRGRMTAWFARRGARVVGGDRYFDYLAAAAPLARREGVTLVQLRGEQLPFRAGSFDLVFTKSVFVFLERPRALEEMARVLKAGGAVWLVENMKYNPLALLVRAVRLLSGQRWVARANFLTWAELESYRAAFARYEHGEFHLLTPLLHPVPLPRRWFRRFAAWESRVLDAVPALRRLAWLCCVVAWK